MFPKKKVITAVIFSIVLVGLSIPVASAVNVHRFHEWTRIPLYPGIIADELASGEKNGYEGGVGNVVVDYIILFGVSIAFWTSVAFLGQLAVGMTARIRRKSKKNA